MCKKIKWENNKVIYKYDDGVVSKVQLNDLGNDDFSCYLLRETKKNDLTYYSDGTDVTLASRDITNEDSLNSNIVITPEAAGREGYCTG